MYQPSLFEEEEWPIPVKFYAENRIQERPSFRFFLETESDLPDWFIRDFDRWDHLRDIGAEIVIHTLINKDGSYEVTKVTGV